MESCITEWLPRFLHDDEMTRPLCWILCNLAEAVPEMGASILDRLGAHLAALLRRTQHPPTQARGSCFLQHLPPPPGACSTVCLELTPSGPATLFAPDRPGCLRAPLCQPHRPGRRRARPGKPERMLRIASRASRLPACLNRSCSRACNWLTVMAGGSAARGGIGPLGIGAGLPCLWQRPLASGCMLPWSFHPPPAPFATLARSLCGGSLP